jgi:hypothetical protein
MLLDRRDTFGQSAKKDLGIDPSCEECPSAAVAVSAISCNCNRRKFDEFASKFLVKIELQTSLSSVSCN